MFEGGVEVGGNFVEVEGNPIEMTVTYEYKPGLELYEYHYQMFIPLLDVTGTNHTTIEIEGYAYLYFREDGDGNWSIYDWEDYRLVSSSHTWGALRAQHI